VKWWLNYATKHLHGLAEDLVAPTKPLTKNLGERGALWVAPP